MACGAALRGDESPESDGRAAHWKDRRSWGGVTRRIREVERHEVSGIPQRPLDGGRLGAGARPLKREAVCPAVCGAAVTCVQ